MRWTERQRAMLREMGVRLWLPEDAPAHALTQSTPTGEGVSTSEARASAPARMVAPAPAAPPRRGAGEPDLDAPRIPGLAPADWLVVGEPLDAGDPQQEQLLENMLRAIGVALVAPGRERRAVYCDLAGTNADPARLRSALDTVAPRCVLAFGRAAAAALLGADAPLGGLRGRVHAHAGVPVVVTFSLAFLLRHPAEKAKAWADLCLAVRSLVPSERQ